MARARFELTKLARSRIAVGSQLLWQDATQITCFGIGPESWDADRSEYRMKTTNVVAYTTVRPVQWLSLGGETDAGQAIPFYLMPALGGHNTLPPTSSSCWTAGR